MIHQVHETFGNKLRVRVCGICIENERVLLADHAGLGPTHFWAPPGGGIQIGESATQALVREFKEETGVDITVGNFLFACEHIKMPLHAVELFFQVTITAGTPAPGYDPELKDSQIIQELQFFSEADILNTPPAHLHGIFQKTSNPARLQKLLGYFNI